MPLFDTGLDPLANLRPASFRGARFHVRDDSEDGGRRAAVHEFPLRSRPLVEDLGGARRGYSFTAYTIGDTWEADRDELRRACFDESGPGTLVHPWLGELQVQCLTCSVHHDMRRVGEASFRLTFVEAGEDELRTAVASTASSVLSRALQVIRALQAAYAISVLIANKPQFLRNFLLSGLGNFAESLLGLPVGTVGAVRNAALGLAGTVDSSAATAVQAADAFAAVVTATQAAPPASADPAAVLTDLVAWSGAIAPADATATPDRAQQAVNARALTDLVRGLAVVSVAQIYAEADFASAEDAAAARTRLLSMLDDRLTAAADAADDDSYAEWQALAAAVAADLSDRAQNLPRRAPYAVGRALPSLVLAYRLGVDAEALAALNGVRHPGFMPLEGVYLK